MHLAGGGGDRHIWITSLTRDTVKVRGQKLSIGDRGVVEIPNVGPVEAYVIAVDRDIARLQLLPGDAEREALLVKFHAEDNVPGVGEVSPVNLIRDFLHHDGLHLLHRQLRDVAGALALFTLYNPSAKPP